MKWKLNNEVEERKDDVKWLKEKIRMLNLQTIVNSLIYWWELTFHLAQHSKGAISSVNDIWLVVSL